MLLIRVIVIPGLRIERSVCCIVRNRLVQKHELNGNVRHILLSDGRVSLLLIHLFLRCKLLLEIELSFA